MQLQLATIHDKEKRPRLSFNARQKNYFSSTMDCQASIVLTIAVSRSRREHDFWKLLPVYIMLGYPVLVTVFGITESRDSITAFLITRKTKKQIKKIKKSSLHIQTRPLHGDCQPRLEFQSHVWYSATFLTSTRQSAVPQRQQHDRKILWRNLPDAFRRNLG